MQAWLMLLLVESSVNEDIMPGRASSLSFAAAAAAPAPDTSAGLNALYDTWYWVFSTLLGGADKAPVTVGGKIIFCAHTFFSVVIIATYTGGVAAFLTQQASVPVVTGYFHAQTWPAASLLRAGMGQPIRVTLPIASIHARSPHADTLATAAPPTSQSLVTSPLFFFAFFSLKPWCGCRVLESVVGRVQRGRARALVGLARDPAGLPR